jgi:hypothetical protein
VDVSDILSRAGLTSRNADDDAPDIPDESIPDDISSLEPLLEPDPKPKHTQESGALTSGWIGSSRAKKAGGSLPPKVTAKQRSEIEDALTMIQIMVGGTLQLRDPHCGGAIVDQAETVAKKAVPIICRNPQWVSWFTSGTGWLDILGLIIALRPVVGTVWGHHVTHTIGDAEGGDGSADDLSAFTAPSL